MTEWAAALAIVSPISAMVVAWLAFGRNRRRDNQEAGAGIATMQSDIGYIKAGNDDIKSQLEDISGQVTQLRERITSVEASAKQAHHRIDRLESGGSAH
jgi:peptidoglycan hydrolase CwlO-like protein